MKSEHPSKDITGTSGSSLEGKRICLCVTGSVAAARSADIARHLMRHGAEVLPVMSPSALRIIHPDLLEWATGNKPVIQLTGAIEHVAIAGNVKGKADLVLVAPATANTIGKIAAGIDDTPVTTTVTTAIGEGIPVILVPAMHEPMYSHPIVGENIAKLQDLGLSVLLPRIEEGKAKIAGTDDIFKAVLKKLRPVPLLLSGKKVLITAGRTIEYLDPVRIITNKSTGKMGMAVVRASLAAGADVTVVFGKGSVPPPPGVNSLSVETSDEMKGAVFGELEREHYDIVISTAAVGDWKVESPFPHKVSTRENTTINITLVPTQKIIDTIKEQFPDMFLVAFRAQTYMTEKELLRDALERLKTAQADLIAVNDIGKAGSGFEGDTNELFVIDNTGKQYHIPNTSKSDAAETLVSIITEKYTGSAFSMV